jgi:hypothetical protein
MFTCDLCGGNVGHRGGLQPLATAPGGIEQLEGEGFSAMWGFDRRFARLSDDELHGSLEVLRQELVRRVGVPARGDLTLEDECRELLRLLTARRDERR